MAKVVTVKIWLDDDAAAERTANQLFKDLAMIFDDGAEVVLAARVGDPTDEDRSLHADRTGGTEQQ